MRRESTLKRRLRQGAPALGTWSVLPSGAVVNVIAASGMDFLIIDMEHGPAGFETAEEMIRAAESENCAALVRVPTNDESRILRALEAGAHGIVVPHISTKAEAEHAVRAAKYAPRGNRGLSPYTRSAGYGPSSQARFTDRENERTLVVLLVEGDEGIANLNEIATVDGVDVVYLGIYDISQAVGHPGELDHPEVVSRIRDSAERLRESGVAAGCLAQNVNDLQRWQQLGMQFIAYAADCGLLINACRSVASQFRNVFEPKESRDAIERAEDLIQT